MEITQDNRFQPMHGLYAADEKCLVTKKQDIYDLVHDLDQPVYFFANGKAIAAACNATLTDHKTDWALAAHSPQAGVATLGDATFLSTYHTKAALMVGSMANGISSAHMVAAMANAGYLASFGAGGLSPQQIEAAILNIQAGAGGKPYAFNLLNNPAEPELEAKIIDLYLKYGVTVVEASAFLALSKGLVQYHVSGLSQNPDGSIAIKNHLIGKVSRKEIARRMLAPAPENLLNQLVEEGKITPHQAELAHHVPMVDDLTVEADSGGHTDNRPLVGLVPMMLQYRDEMMQKFQYATPVRIGAGGGLGTPAAIYAAFALGAAYVVTGSINQACVEAGTSAFVRELLAKVEMTDMTMAPAGDMFEMGVKVQVVKRGSSFAMRAQKLFDLYSRHESIEALPLDEREKLETTIFKQSIDEVWQACVTFFKARDERPLMRAQANAKEKMALIFRWYLGMSSRWAVTGETGREADYQIWCGPAMGCFNDWVRGTHLADAANRHVVDVSNQLLRGAAGLRRIDHLESQGLQFPGSFKNWKPEQGNGVEQ